MEALFASRRYRGFAAAATLDLAGANPQDPLTGACRWLPAWQAPSLQL
jgi:hypothetical protein